jgi:hypothetical protein
MALVGPVVSWHADRYPALAVEDLYKLLHQAVAGPGHAIDNEDMARSWLEAEWSGLEQPMAGEARIEPLSPDGRLVRVNLRPWKADGRPQERLLSAFVRTAKEIAPAQDQIHGSMEKIRACIGDLARGAGIRPASVDSFFFARAKEGYPAVHHSEGYSSEYDPAYRVVLQGFLD